MKKSISLRKEIQSIAVMLYFLMLVMHNLFQSALLNYAWYLVLGLCFILGVLKKKIRISNSFAALMLLLVVFGLLNYFAVGNATLAGVAFTVIYAGVCLLLMDDGVDERYILIALYADCLLMAYRIIRAGLGNPIFGEMSNNFASVLLFLPTIVYYTRAEYYGKKISIIPSLAVTMTCVLAMGRGGMISAALLSAFLLLYVARTESNWKSKYYQSLFKILLVFLALIVIVVGLSFVDRIKSLSVFERFSKFGMYGTGRAGIWEEYLTNMVRNVKNILLGVSYQDLPLMERYRGNLHNSFFNFHADYGLIVLLFLLGLIASNGVRCIRKKRWIYLSVMIIFFVRAFTDRIFGGGSAATPILFFVLLHIRDKKQPVDILQYLKLLTGRNFS